MALETCIAFLLADEFDAEDYSYLKTKTQNKIQQSRGHDDDYEDKEEGEEEENFFSAVVPRLSVLDFQKCFQLSQHQVEELVNLLSPCKWNTETLEGWSVLHTVLASLWTLSTLEPHSSIATRFHTSESLLCQKLHEFCALVVKNMADQISWPKWKEADSSVAGFSFSVGLPGVVCVLGSCLIPINRPTDVPDPETYYDPENGYSVNLMAFCNYQGCFTYVSAEHPGSWHNSEVLLETEVGNALQQDPLNLLNGRHIIGDASFPLSEHLLTPFPDYGTLVEKKLRYNIRVQAALQVVREALCSLRCRFQRLRSLPFNSVVQSSLVVKTCCILYNMYLEPDADASVGCLNEQINIQQPFHELPTGHSGSLGGISKRQDIAASLGRKLKKYDRDQSYKV